MKIRKVKKEDLSQYLKLKEKGLKEYSEISHRKFPVDIKEIKKEFYFIEKYPKKNRFLFISEENGIIQGFLVGTLLTYSFQKTGYVDDLFVEKDFRNKSVARSLIKEFIKVTKKKGARKFRLGVDIKNKKAIKLYEKMGFKITHYEMEK